MTSDRPVRFSVVVPVYGNRDSLPTVVDRLVELGESRSGILEAVFVVDGSPDDSLAVLRACLAEGRLDSQILSLSRNFGSFSAIMAGMAVARGEYLGVMAADLQEPVEVVAAFFDELEADRCDLVLGERVGRDDPVATSGGSRAFWWLYRRFVNSDIPPGGVDVFGCTREIAQVLITFPERHTSLVGLLYWVGYRRAYVPYERVARHSGKSAWGFRRRLRYLFDSVYAFTDLPIILLQVIGLLGFLGSAVFGLVVLIAWAMGGITQPGYTPLMITLLASTSAVLLGLGVVGSYVWRTYENGKGRPLELVASHEYYGPGAR